MKTKCVKEKLHLLVDEMSDKKVKALYTLLENQIGILQYNKEIEEAEEELRRGEFITHEQLKRQIKQWH